MAVSTAIRLLLPLLVLVAHAGLAHSGEPISAKPFETGANASIRHMSTGPEGSGPVLRMSLVLFEVSYSVIVEEIFYDPLKEGEPSVESSHLLIGRDLAKPLGISKLTDLRFVRWLSGSEAELRNGDIQFIVSRVGRGMYEVRPLSAR